MVGLFYRKNTIVGEVPWGVEGVPSSCALLAPSFTTCRYQTLKKKKINFVLGKEKED
jgi:hypothetical protein